MFRARAVSSSGPNAATVLIWSILGLLVLTLIGLSAGCRAAPEPVGRVSVEPGVVELEYPGIETLELRFEPTAELAPQRGTPYVFVHILDRPGHVLRTFDHPLPGTWAVGMPVTDRVELYQSALAEALAPGSYLLSVGLYDEASGRRWSLDTAGEEIARQEYRLATVKVPEHRSDLATARFGGAWYPPLAGDDLQILGRRCLSATSEIRLGEPAVPLEVRLQLSLPEWASQVADESLRIWSSCGGSASVLNGSGIFDLSLDVSPPAGLGTASAGDEKGCFIRFEPAYAAPATMLGDDEALACLRLLAWRPAATGTGADKMADKAAGEVADKVADKVAENVADRVAGEAVTP